MPAPVQIKTLGPADAALLDNLAPDVFDNPPRAGLTREFLADPRHHIVVAIDDGAVVGMATGVHYVHPDKPAELFINEVGVAPSHRRAGVGRMLIEALLSVARDLGCREAWVLTDRNNEAAGRLYASAGGRQSEDEVVMFGWEIGG